MALSIDNLHMLQQSCTLILKSKSAKFYQVKTYDLSLSKAHYKSVMFKNGRYHYTFDGLTSGFLIVEVDKKFMVKKIGEHLFLAVTSKKEKDVYALSSDLIQTKLDVLFEFDDLRIYKCEEPYFKIGEHILPMQNNLYKLKGNLGISELESVDFGDISLGSISFGQIELPSISMQEFTLNSVLPTVSFKEL
ncbi:MAG: hypothetical protein EOL93_00720 [Epsilonproteobacteria bacterium]|nr:hypothetical protein [Campylobacterota bacterium]